jgi:peptidyl-prolyl cis-trans isomerase C
VQSQFGFHVIKVEDRRVQQPPAFDQVKDQVRQIVFRDAYLEKVKALRAAATVEITDPALKEAIDKIENAETQE